MLQVSFHQMTAAYWQKGLDDLNNIVVGQNCTRYIRFDHSVRLIGFEINALQRKWGLTSFSILPKHIRISITDAKGLQWNTIYEKNDFSPQANHKMIFENPIFVQFLKVELLEHHGSSGAHIEIAGNPKCLLFQSLDGFHCLLDDGVYHSGTQEQPFMIIQPCLIGDRNPVPAKLPPSIRYEVKSGEILFTNLFCRLGFSLLRPMNTVFAWDSLETGREQDNFLFRGNKRQSLEAAHGPWISQITGDRHAGHCGGEVEVAENKIKYLNISPISGLTRNYCFTIEENYILLEIEQFVAQPIKAIECEAWKWIWNAKKSALATLANPFTKGKNGRCSFPAICHSPNYGNIQIQLMEGDSASSFLKVDSWRKEGFGYLGIECGVTVDDDGELLLLPGTTRMKLKISPAALGLIEPESPDASALHLSFLRAWGSVFGFRSEYFGMSNNAYSLNCHFVQHVYADMAFHTSSSEGVDTMELLGYSVRLALFGGMGYGDNRDYFLDSDASLLIAAGVYIFKTKNVEWVNQCWAPLLECGQRLLSKRLDNGLVACHKLSGNAGEHHWGSNWWDIISFGYLDAFSNAFIYRAFRQLQSIAEFIGDVNTRNIYKQAADTMQREFFHCFYNEETGWLAGWRSKDGKLHDYAFLFVNGIAIVYGLVPQSHRQRIMEKLEEKRMQIGYEFFHLGLPGNLMPIRREDYVLHVSGSSKLADGSDGFQNYENGGATMSQAYFYLRALDMAGMPIAEKIGNAILDAFEQGDTIGGIWGGNDWRYLDGRYCGYEGLLSDQMYVLLAVAQNKGLASDIPIEW